MSTKRAPFRRPQQQGRVDGMCAIYAAINAAKFLFDHSEKQDEALLKHVCTSCPDLFPSIVFEGTGVKGVRRVLSATANWVQQNHPRSALRFSTPLMRRRFEEVQPYFDALRSGIGSSFVHDSRLPTHRPFRASGIWLVGLGTPWDHWTCVNDFTDRLIMFYDSYGMRKYRHESFTLNPKMAGADVGKKIMIDYHQSFWVQRIDSAP